MTSLAEVPIMSSADVVATERFDVMVSVVEADRTVESSSKKRNIELEEILLGLLGCGIICGERDCRDKATYRDAGSRVRNRI
jgi:hypothetical protein